MKKIYLRLISFVLIILIIFICIFYAYNGYTQKNVNQVYLTINALSALPLLILILDIFFSLFNKKYLTLFSFFSGNFSFKEDSNTEFQVFNKILYGQYAIFAIINLILVPYGFYQFAMQLDPIYLFISSISIIAAGAALANMSFKYAHEGTNSEHLKDVLFACAKRFYLTTIYSIITIFFTIIVIILSKWILAISSSTLPNAVNLPPLQFSLISLELCILSVVLFFFILVFISTIRIFIEGLYLAFEGSIDYSKFKN
ncbi:MAG: hypothetical protein LLF83_08015 [Methanobacterium sp.]|nr:hypothetical protein [Methanobacterium sp.]